jgi:SAM-dependent methyltransferase
MTHVDFDSYTDNYNELLREETNFFSADEAYFAKYKVEIARRVIPGEPKTILEYGCGIGRNLSFLQRRFPGAEISGSDISVRSLDVAKAENPGMYFWEEGDRTTEKSGFDFIFVAGVFHHVPVGDRKASAETIASRLNLGGSVMVFEHNPYNPITRRIVDHCPFDADAVLLRPNELRGLLENAGLKVSGQGYALFFPPALRIPLGLESMLGWLPLGGQYWVHATRV